MAKITEMFAFIACDAGPDDEGVCSFWSEGMGVHMPMVGADMARVESLKGIAQEIANKTGKSIRIARFSTRIDGEVIKPQ